MTEDFFQALASPCRREIIKLLRWGSMSAGEIAEKFDISQPSVSRHLDILRKAEIVTCERRANQMIYSLNLSVTEEIVMRLTDLFSVPREREKEGPAGEGEKA